MSRSALAKTLGRSLAWVGIIALIVAGAVAGFIHMWVPPGDPDRFAARCGSNLHSIGEGLLLYRNDHRGIYPSSWAEAVAGGQIAPELLVCPATDDSPAVIPPGAGVLMVAAALGRPGHVSYVYCARGWNQNDVRADAIVAYEPTSNHNGLGSEFLFGDDHVDWIDSPRAARLIAAAAATTRPVSAATVP